MSNVSVEDRRANLSDRMSDGSQNWQDHRQDMQNDRQDWRDQNREDWQNWADDKHDHYGDWYHGGWYPGAGWGYMWDNYPVAAALGLTGWAVNRIGYGWGYYDYANPYYTDGAGYGYNYSEPLVIYADAPVTATDQAPPASPSQLQPTDEGLAAFEEARTAFHDGDYATALAKLDITLKTMPRDTVVHEFRGLVLFALKKYPEAAAAIYAVLSAGPGWDWTTMISLYPGIEPYTSQLRALEEFVKANPKSANGHFLVAYHYQTMNFAESAAKQFREALNLLPNDKLLKQLVAMTAPLEKTPQAPPRLPPQTAASEKSLTAEQLVGNWKASTQGKAFELDLSKDGSFTWTYQRGNQKQSVKGVFAIDENNLALETHDGGGTMLAQVDLTSPSQLQFKMVGDDPKEPGLKFQRN
jgi:tetratricopeptide (TPR) repeat protein